MRKEELTKKLYTKPDARLVVFNYREVVMASAIDLGVGETGENTEDAPPGETNQ